MAHPLSLHRLCPSLPFDLNVDPARTIYEVSLLDYESKSSVTRLDISRAVMDQVSSERTGGAACGRIFGDVIGRRKQACVRAGFADLNRFTSKRVATSSAHAFVESRPATQR